MGISETRWPGENEYYSNQFRIIQSGGEESQRGVAIILDQRTANAVEKIHYEGDRLLTMRLKGKPVDLCIIQVYMPTSGHTDEEVEEMYEKIDELIDSETRSKDYTIVMGDFSAVVGEGKEGKYVGHYGLGCCNQRGEKLMEFCRRREMCTTNTWFCQDKRRYTWTMPGS